MPDRKTAGPRVPRFQGESDPLRFLRTFPSTPEPSVGTVTFACGFDVAAKSFWIAASYCVYVWARGHSDRDDTRLEEEVVGFWTNFAARGDPNGAAPNGT